MTSHEPPVYMDEDDDRSCLHSHMSTAVEEASVSYLPVLIQMSVQCEVNYLLT